MLNIRYLVAIILLFYAVNGYCDIQNKIDETQYSIDYSIDNYDNEKKQLLSYLNIHLKQKSKIFVKNKANDEPQTRVTLENKRNISAVEIKWPMPEKSSSPLL